MVGCTWLVTIVSGPDGSVWARSSWPAPSTWLSVKARPSSIFSRGGAHQVCVARARRTTLDADVFSETSGAQLTRARRATRGRGCAVEIRAAIPPGPLNS